jgi:hypothetical protein
MRVFEWQIQAGVAYRHPVSGQIDLSAALVTGALVHDYALADATALNRIPQAPATVVVSWPLHL